VFAPRWIAVVDLESLPERLEAPVRPGEPACRFLAARVLVRLHGAPLGLIEVPLIDGVVEGDRIAAAIDRDLWPNRVPTGAPTAGDAILASQGPEPDPWPAVSVVVGTRERPELLERCLASLCAVDYPDFEVVVVDNAAETDRTRKVVEACPDPRVRYIHNAIRGVSAARNLGIAETTSEYVALTDDDVVVDPAWLRGLVRGFGRRADVAIVTGLVLPLELETESQAMFERRVSWGSELNARLYALDSPPPDDPLFPFSCGAVGAGASMAVRRGAVAVLGGFDCALGPGSPSRAAEDIDYFYRALTSGFGIAYEPTSLAWHRHRRDLAGLEEQLGGYGTGLAAFGFKQFQSPATAARLVRHLPSLVRYALAGSSKVSVAGEGLSDAGALPKPVRRRELRGMLLGPVAYMRGRSHAATGDGASV
jgi:GT2 family glycosyltransferase